MPARSARTVRSGQRTGKGLNENLARECLELHTVSPASGYTQADVTSFARVITGWSVANGDKEPAGFRSGPWSTSRASRRCWAAASRPARRAASRRSPSWPTTRRPTATSRPSWCSISSPTCRRPPRCAGSRRCCTTPAATWPGGLGAGRARRGVAAARPSCAARRTTCWRRCARPTCRRISGPTPWPSCAGWGSRCSGRRSRSAGRTARSTGPGRRR